MARDLEKRKAYLKAYYEANKEKVKAKVKAYREAHKDEIKAYKKAWYEANKDKRKAQNKAWYEANKDERKAYQKAYHKEKLKNDQLFAFKYDVRKVTALAFIRCGYKKNSRTEKLLGCTFEELRKQLNPPNDFFTNRSKYHIDHIVPLATAKTMEDVIRLSHHTNLQILTAEENMAKGARY